MENKVRSRPFFGILVMTALAVGIYYKCEHHWPNSYHWLGWITGWTLMESYKHIVRLVERQSTLLEQVLGVLKAERQEYEEPLGRR